MFSCEHAPTSVDFSPNGDFIATAHAGHTGIYLWANTDHLSPVELRSSAQKQKLPSSRPDELENGAEDILLPPEELTTSVTLSGVPRPHWANLAMLDQIKARNKAEEAIKEKEEAPFFLPMLPGLEPKFVEPPKEEATKAEEDGWQAAPGAWNDEDEDENEEFESDDSDKPDLDQPSPNVSRKLMLGPLLISSFTLPVAQSIY